MEFSEANTPWRSIPEWAAFLIEFGYVWVARPCNSRRIAVISMPSDSAAAGLVTLGVMRRYLAIDGANDKSSHYDRLIALARKGASLRHNNIRGVFKFDGFYREGVMWVRKRNSQTKERRTIQSSSALDWHVDGEPPIVLANGQQLPNSQFYSHLIRAGDEIVSSNLSESHSQVCLAGRGAGEAPTRASMADIRFREDGTEADLSQLLTIQNWMPGTISRVRFYNSRTAQFDRQAGIPQVVIADGDTCFLSVVDAAEFCDSDVIGIVHRTMERDRLEAIGTRLESLRQWYDHAEVDGLTQSPRGVGIFVLKRRQ